MTNHKDHPLMFDGNPAFLIDFIEQSPFSTWVADENGTMIWQNKANRKLFQVTDKQVVGKYSLKEDEEGKAQDLSKLTNNVFKKGETVNFEIKYNTGKIKHIRDLIFKPKNPQELTLEVTIFPVKNAKGKVTHAVVQNKDVTEQRKAETALKESKKMYQELVEGVKDGILTIDTSAKITFANKYLLELGKYTEDDLIGKRFQKFVPTRYLPLALKMFTQGLKGVESPAAEMELITKDKKTIPVSYKGPRVRKDGKITGVLAIIRNLSDKKTTELKLHEQMEQLKQMNDSMISRELKMIELKEEIQKLKGKSSKK